MRYITDAPNAPKAIGPYSQAVVCGDFAFLSGQVSLDAETGQLVGGDIKVQTRQVLKNLSAVLAALGLNFSNVVKSTIFLTDLGNFSAVNDIYSEALAGVKPARATVQVAGLPKGAAVEIEMIAWLRS